MLLYCSVVALLRELQLCCSCYMGHMKNGKDPCGNFLLPELKYSVTTMEFSAGKVKMIISFLDLSRTDESYIEKSAQ